MKPVKIEECLPVHIDIVDDKIFWRMGDDVLLSPMLKVDIDLISSKVNNNTKLMTRNVLFSSIDAVEEFE